MLPGFRFLFAAIIVSMSILVFGLGAAALLRTAHEQFASTPAWRAAPEANFAQQADTTRPVLAMLRVEPEPRSPDSAPAVDVPPSAEPAAMAAAPAEPDPATESPQQTETAAAPTDAPAVIDAPGTAAPAAETRVASTEQGSPPQLSVAANDAAPAKAETDAASTKIATLGGPPVAVETSTPIKAAAGAKPDQGSILKHRQARRAAQRRRLAARARLAARLASPQLAAQPSEPFAQPLVQPAATRKH